MSRRNLLTTFGVVLAGALGCSGKSAQPRPLTAEEADALSLARFRNYQAGGRAVRISVPSGAGTLTVAGSVDFHAGVGYGVLTDSTPSAPGQGLLQWTTQAMVVDEVRPLPATAPADPPRSGWQGRALQTTGSSLDTALLITLSLGADRPDNAQLLQQSDARWVQEATADGVKVDVIDGPTTAQSATARATGSAVRYWVARDGTLYRVRAQVASAPRPVVIDFPSEPYAPVHPIAGLPSGSTPAS
jgi:hypothetical protein